MSELLHGTLDEGIAIETVVAAGLWRASVDPCQLENTILNLAVNARDAMPEGGGVAPYREPSRQTPTRRAFLAQ